METDKTNFGFGIEAELLLCTRDTFAPLGYEDLDFDVLMSILDTIPVDDISTAGFNIKPLHKSASPYLIEGYTLTDAAMKPQSLLPKGIEIRTPLVDSIEQTTADLRLLYDRLTEAMSRAGYACSIVSHHPLAKPLDAPRNYTRYEYWQWALTATTTYGPDINISLPDDLARDIDLVDLDRKVNFYLPAVIALSFASPVSEGKLWKIGEKIGKSIRTYRRSLWAPIFYVHEKPSLRFEFKGFEMTSELADYHAFFLIGLAMLLDHSLVGRADEQNRIDSLRSLAVDGLHDSQLRERAAVILDSAQKTAVQLGLTHDCLSEFRRRLEAGYVPADSIVGRLEQGATVPDILRESSRLHDAECSVDSTMFLTRFSRPTC